MGNLRLGGGECDGNTLRPTDSRVQRAVRPNGTRNNCTDLLCVSLRELCAHPRKDDVHAEHCIASTNDE
eukprot:2449020-Alexandrium_andersonii.AAC.1